MVSSWALKYRPQTFRDMVGQRQVQAVLHYMVNRHTAEGAGPRIPHTIPHALLFHGPRGTGKTSAARIVAKALNCEDGTERPCATCTSCKSVAEGTSPALEEVDAASAGLVADIRKLTDLVSYDNGMPCRVVLLDEAHSMSREGFNALLKTLEEPPPRTVFILVTTEPSRVLPTVVSRCTPFEFRRIAPEFIRRRLADIAEQEQFAVEPELVAELADRAGGALRDAIMALDQACRAGADTLARYQWLHGESDFAPVLVAAMAARDHSAMFTQLDQVLARTGDTSWVVTSLIRCLRDLLVLHAGGTLEVAGAPLARRQALAAQVPATRAAAALRVLWDLQAHVRGIAPHAALTLATAMCAEVMSDPAPQPAAPVNGTNGHTPLGADRITQMAQFSGALRGPN